MLLSFVLYLIYVHACTCTCIYACYMHVTCTRYHIGYTCIPLNNFSLKCGFIDSIAYLRTYYPSMQAIQLPAPHSQPFTQRKLFPFKLPQFIIIIAQMSTHAVMYVVPACMALAAWGKCEFTQVFLNHLHASSWLSLYNALPMITELLVCT